MNTRERLYWVAGIVLLLLFAQQQSHKADDLQTLMTTYQLESNIQDAQIVDIAQQVNQAAQIEYSKGFEAGKTQAAIILMDEGTLYDYADGYHAALTQQVEESAVLEVSEAIMFELNSLRKMVPRLLNQNEALEVDLAIYEALSGDINSSEDVDSVYLDLIDMLLDPVEENEEFIPHQRTHTKELVNQEKGE